MTFAGVKDIAIYGVGVPEVFRYSIGQAVACGPDCDDPCHFRGYVFAIDYASGEMLLGRAAVRRSFWQRLRSAWRVLRGGLP